MLARQTLDKEQYRAIITTYFEAFDTGDYSPVQFSPKIKFLSPLSQNTFDGVETVSNFLTGVSTRVAEVNIFSTTVEYPTASGVWEMKTTKGTVYTLNNFFRLDEQGIAYIWPMFDPKAIAEDPDRFIAWLTGEGY